MKEDCNHKDKERPVCKKTGHIRQCARQKAVVLIDHVLHLPLVAGKVGARVARKERSFSVNYAMLGLSEEQMYKRKGLSSKPQTIE